MEKILLSPYFQVTLAAVVGIGVVGLGLAAAVFKFFLPRLGKALFATACGEPSKDRPPMMINPEFCTACKTEHERSLRNETDIKEVKADVKNLANEFHQGVINLGSEIGNMKQEIIKTLAAPR